MHCVTDWHLTLLDVPYIHGSISWRLSRHDLAMAFRARFSWALDAKVWMEAFGGASMLHFEFHTCVRHCKWVGSSKASLRHVTWKVWNNVWCKMCGSEAWVSDQSFFACWYAEVHCAHEQSSDWATCMLCAWDVILSYYILLGVPRGIGHPPLLLYLTWGAKRDRTPSSPIISYLGCQGG